MKYKHIPIFVLLLLMLAPAASAISDNLNIAIPIGETQCVDIKLPEDSGINEIGKYSVIVDTVLSVNNRKSYPTIYEGTTITRPICFTPRADLVSANTVVDYTITISFNNEVTKTYSGKVCVSDISDSDCNTVTGGSQTGGTQGGDAACTPYDKRCNGKVVEQCSANGDSWLAAEACSESCSNGQCLDNGSAGKPSENTLLYTWIIIIVVLAVVLLMVIVTLKKSKPVKEDYF
ncbi:MAG: hypothetical protein ABIF08_04750 [Nanoarchaeota archaeon]